MEIILGSLLIFGALMLTIWGTFKYTVHRVLDLYYMIPKKSLSADTCAGIDEGIYNFAIVAQRGMAKQTKADLKNKFHVVRKKDEEEQK